MTSQLTNNNILAAGKPAEPVDDPLGLHDWAALNGIQPSLAIAVSGSLLANLAGHSLFFDGFYGLSGMQATSLVASCSDPLLRRAASTLTAHLDVMQRRLIQGSREFSVAAIDQVFHGNEMGVGETASQLKPLDANAPVDCLESTPIDMLGLAAASGTRADHYENLVRPRFMIRDGTPNNLAKTLADFNHGTCLAACTPVLLSNDDRQRQKRVDDLAQFLGGSDVEVTSKSSVKRVTATMRGILTFTPTDLKWLLDHRRDFLDQLVLVSADAPAAAQPFDESRASAFQARFRSSATHILACRRAGSPYGLKFNQQAARAEFLASRLSFIIESAACPPAITTLPDLAAWTLLSLSGGNPPEHQIVRQAMTCARDIRDQAIRMLKAHDQARAARQRLEHGLKMVARLQDKGPVKRRELVRGFSDQRLEIHEPVIQTLICCKVMKEDSDRRLDLGPVPASRLTADDFINCDILLS